MSTAQLSPLEVRREREYFRYRESVVCDEQTWVAENLDAPLEKPIDYRFHQGELWSEQGQPMGDIFKNSINLYQAIAEERPELAFQLRRAQAENREYETMKAMARGEAPNTLIVVSPYPKELETATEPILGYQPDRRLGFLRVLTHEGGGQVRMWAHSFDKSDPQALEAMYEAMGHRIDWGHDVLEQHIAVDIDNHVDRELLRDQLLYAYDASLAKRFGGFWFAGRSKKEHDAREREAVEFVNQQQDLLQAHVDALIHVGPTSKRADKLRYAFRAAMVRRFKGDTSHRDASDGSVATEMATAGHEAAQHGEKASGCGLTIAIEQPSIARQLEEAGFKTNVAALKYLDECMKCPKCKTTGVEVEINGEGAHYTCSGSGGCGASTKPSVAASRNEASMQSQSSEDFALVGKLPRSFWRSLDREEPPKTQIVIGGVVEVTDGA